MTNRAPLSARYIQCSSSTVTVMILLVYPSIDASVAMIFTDKGYDIVIWLVGCCLYSCWSKDMCGDLRSSVSQDSSRSRSFPRYIVDLLIDVYYYGTGVVPKDNRRQRKSNSSIIAVHVDIVVAFSFIWR